MISRTLSIPDEGLDGRPGRVALPVSRGRRRQGARKEGPSSPVPGCPASAATLRKSTESSPAPRRCSSDEVMILSIVVLLFVRRLRPSEPFGPTRIHDHRGRLCWTDADETEQEDRSMPLRIIAQPGCGGSRKGGVLGLSRRRNIRAKPQEHAVFRIYVKKMLIPAVVVWK